MNQLSGKYVNLVLAVENGRGMEFVKHPVHVTANYNGRILESDRISEENGGSFNTELIWEVEKKDLRKLRSSNQPLRVECVSTDPQNRRERIGFVLLSLRSAEIIPAKDAKLALTPKWYKLIGCQTDKKKHHPELYLSLTIRDHLLNNLQEAVPKQTPLISEEEPPKDEEFVSDFPLKYLDDGYIQVGDDDTDLESFSLNLLVKAAKNLDTLLPEALVFRHNNEKYHMTFRIFGVAIKTKPFYKNFQDVFALNEKVVVRLLANEDTLQQFFNSQKIKISLYNGHELLGTTEVDLGDVTFEEEVARCLFALPPPHNVVPFGGDDSSPFLEVTKWLKKSSDSRFKLLLPEKRPTQGFGDQLNSSCVLDKLDRVGVKSKSEGTFLAADQEDLATTRSADTVIRQLPLTPRQCKEEAYVKYLLEVELQSLVWRLPQKDREVVFKFLHPRTSNCITVFTQISNQLGERCDLKNITVKIAYVTNRELMEHLLNSWPPKLLLTDENDSPLSGEYEFDVSRFPGENYKTFCYVANLKSAQKRTTVAQLEVKLTLEEFDLDDNEDSTLELKPPIIDEVLTLKELADLARWKKHQKEVFQKEAQLVQEEQSRRLEALWQEKRRVMEQKLQGQMDKCGALQEELQQRLDGIKTDKYLLRRRNHSNIFEDIFRENWEKYCDSDRKDIIQLLSRTQRDNEYLRKLVEDQRRKLQLLEKTSLTKEQTGNLLQELKGLEKGFEEAQTAKKYFKEQWKRACEEIHEMKTEEYKSLQVNLIRSREELSRLSLDGLLTDRSAADSSYTFR